jgi:hypothetical protein
MHERIRNILVAFVFSIAFVGCSTLAPDPSIHINGDSSLTWSDAREIDLLRPSLGIKQPITEITAKGPDRAEIYCEIRPPAIVGWGTSSVSTEPGEGLEFTVVRRGGHWVVLGRPRKSGRIIACA